MSLRTEWHNLTGFQRDILEAIADVEADGETPYGLALKRNLSEKYGEEVNHGRLYPNLDDLVQMGFVEKSELDKRTNEYRLTERASVMLDGALKAFEDAVEGRTQERAVADGGDVDE